MNKKNNQILFILANHSYQYPILLDYFKGFSATKYQIVVDETLTFVKRRVWWYLHVITFVVSVSENFTVEFLLINNNVLTAMRTPKDVEVSVLQNFIVHFFILFLSINKLC